MSLTAEFTFESSRSTHFDAIIFVGGSSSDYVSLKTIGATGNAVDFITDICLLGDFSPATKNENEITIETGVILAKSVGTGAEYAQKFIMGVSKHHVWDREIEHIAACGFYW